jgi:hypothetical protein
MQIKNIHNMSRIQEAYQQHRVQQQYNRTASDMCTSRVNINSADKFIQ